MDKTKAEIKKFKKLEKKHTTAQLRPVITRMNLNIVWVDLPKTFVLQA
jgi:hypothetical protein